MPGTGLISFVSSEPLPFVISKNNVPKSVPPLIAGRQAQGCGFPW